MGGLDNCQHHWVIETAKGPTSLGRCKKCHEVKEFRNHYESSWYGDKDKEVEGNNNDDGEN